MTNVKLHHLVQSKGGKRAKEISAEEKFDVISRLQKGEGIVDVCRNFRLSRTVGDNADRITESAKCTGNINANDLKQLVFV